MRLASKSHLPQTTNPPESSGEVENYDPGVPRSPKMTAKRLFCTIASLLLVAAAVVTSETVRGGRRVTFEFEANSDSVGSPLALEEEEPVDPGPAAEPKITDCLVSAVKEEDCGSVVEGCYWCAEPGEEHFSILRLQSFALQCYSLLTYQHPRPTLARCKSTACV